MADYDTLGGTRILSDTDAYGRKTEYEYADTVHLSKVKLPEGNYVEYEYDRNRLTKVKSFPKGGGTPQVVEAGYPSTCTAATAKVCNKPLWMKDAKGNQTDYTYDAQHGGVLTETGPADANGVRPQVRYTYELRQAQGLNSSNQMVNTEAPVWRLIRTSSCTTASWNNPAGCVGTVNEQIKEYAYNHPNLLVTSETVRAGDNSLSVTTSYTYDLVGNVTSVDGPRTDVDDRSYATYDAFRRKIFEIGVDPDGGGALKRQVIKHYYDTDGFEYRSEVGTGNATDGSDFVWSSAKKMTYDATGLLLKTEVVVP
ncbi:hypothetical protein AEYBE204_19360 [Asticcacaulis sp. YBE204]|nr:hypothetical protein AEYBE204_19360 [Asticcacaulis sp. YBE204]